jgi:hypothetical protein
MSVMPRILIASALMTLTLAACQAATPDKVLRVEGVAPLAPSLCHRMVEDFHMTPAEGSDLRGYTYSVSLVSRAFSKGGIGVNWYFKLSHQDASQGTESCKPTPKGMTCAIRGPAQFHVQSNAGQATYLVAAGDRATVSSEGAMMFCREPPPAG